MNVAHNYHSATRLKDGNVLVVAGGGTNESELYVVAAKKWVPVAQMPTNSARFNHTATLLNESGKVLVAGGSSDREAHLFSMD